ncbi:preprotein translocase subunit SecG [Bryobacter aggregatus]|uniref:preprotein translocase subunit SecG n=1 Tax=Bryobacter aggregatus TaxID=360054 RepID=UPI0009B5A66A|nr:preprotein translocase subunit SecG [Bryobacter aggregatus]
MIVILVTIVHVLVCLILIGVVLLQSGKAADLAGAFGGMGSQTTFGPRSAATVLSRVTTTAAALFMVTSLTLAVLATRGGAAGGGSGTVFDRTNVPAPAPQVEQKAPSQTPAVEMVDEQGRVVSKQEVELPKDAEKKAAKGEPVPVKLGKKIPVDANGNEIKTEPKK